MKTLIPVVLYTYTNFLIIGKMRCLNFPGHRLGVPLFLLCLSTYFIKNNFGGKYLNLHLFSLKYYDIEHTILIEEMNASIWPYIYMSSSFVPRN